MSREPTAETIAVWTRLNRASSGVQSAIDDALKKAGLPPLDWYYALSEVKNAGESGVRPFELIQELGIAQYKVSRLLGVLENNGLVRRKKQPGDARGQVVHLTGEGSRVHGKIWTVVAGALQQSIGDQLEITEALRLGQLLQQLSPQ